MQEQLPKNNGCDSKKKNHFINEQIFKAVYMLNWKLIYFPESPPPITINQPVHAMPPNSGGLL